MRNKRGQLGNLSAFVGTLIVIGVLVAAGFFVIQEFSEQEEFYSDAISITDEYNAHANTTGYTVAYETGLQTKSFVAVSVYGDGNQTDGTQAAGDNLPTGYNMSIPAANYSLHTERGLLTNATTYVYSNLTVNYTFVQGEEGWIGVNDTLSAMRTIPDLLGLIILIVMVGIVLVIVFNVIPGARVSGA